MRLALTSVLSLLAALICGLLPISAAEQGCPGLVARRDLPIAPVALGTDEVRLTYIGDDPRA